VAMSRQPTPTIRRWQLGQQLRQLREDAEVSAMVAAKEIGVSASSLSRIETGKQFIKPPYVKLLALLYGVEPELRTRLMELADEASRPEWYAALAKNVPDWFRQYLGYESVASRIEIYDQELVPGPLQTEEYTAAVIRATRRGITEAQLQQQLALREQRKERAAQNDVHLSVVVNEAVLLRLVGGRSVLRNQLDHLAKLSELPNIDLHVLPFAAGAHSAMTSSFTLLGFNDYPEMDCVYIENGRGALYLESPADLQEYGWRFSQLVELSPSQVESRDLLVKVSSDL
jgi:transcriptional regulator with XRE-family HTH domain